MWVGVRWGGRLSGASANEALIVIAISFLALPFAIVGAVAAQALAWLYQLVELVVFLLRRAVRWLLRRPAPEESAPVPAMLWAD